MVNLFSMERYDALPPGSELHGYRLDSVLSSGSFGITYHASHGIFGTRHVIKEFIPDCAIREGGTTVRPRSAGAKNLFEWGLKSFFDEACLLHGLSHPSVVKVSDVFKANGTAYFVMPFLSGGTLGEWMAAHLSPTRKELEDVFVPLLEGLKYIHREKLLHRDIKPENVYIQDNGHPVLIDFGAARHAIGQESKTFTQILTAHFAPIEQYSSKGEFTAAMDIYSLAACMYVAVTGNLPDEAPERLMNDRLVKLAGDAKHVKTYGGAFLSAIDKAMSVSPRDRFQSAFDFQKALLELNADAPAQSLSARNTPLSNPPPIPAVQNISAHNGALPLESTNQRIASNFIVSKQDERNGTIIQHILKSNVTRTLMRLFANIIIGIATIAAFLACIFEQGVLPDIQYARLPLFLSFFIGGIASTVAFYLAYSRRRAIKQKEYDVYIKLTQRYYTFSIIGWALLFPVFYVAGIMFSFFVGAVPPKRIEQIPQWSNSGLCGVMTCLLIYGFLYYALLFRLRKNMVLPHVTGEGEE